VAFLVFYVVPGKHVWGEENELGPFMVPHWAENLEKAPPDLLRIAEKLAAEREISQGNILCSEEVASFLTPSSRKFRFVVTRPVYSMGLYSSSGEGQESCERFYLMLVAEGGPFEITITQRGWNRIAGFVGDALREKWEQTIVPPKLKDLPELLKRYRVLYVVTSPVIIKEGKAAAKEIALARAKLLQDNGFNAVYRGEEYVLWKRWK
jgi:hypothetical protein